MKREEIVLGHEYAIGAGYSEWRQTDRDRGIVLALNYSSAYGEHIDKVHSRHQAKNDAVLMLVHDRPWANKDFPEEAARALMTERLYLDRMEATRNLSSWNRTPQREALGKLPRDIEGWKIAVVPNKDVRQEWSTYLEFLAKSKNAKAEADRQAKLKAQLYRDQAPLIRAELDALGIKGFVLHEGWKEGHPHTVNLTFEAYHQLVDRTGAN